MKDFKSTTLYLTIFTAALAFLGALGGSFVSGYLNKSLWEQQVVYEQKRQIFDQRIKLIERISKLANLAPQMSNYQAYVLLQARLSQDYLACSKKHLQACIKPDDPKTVLEISNKRADLNAEFSSSLQLTSMYFGTMTRTAATKLARQQPWWEIGESSFRELITAMNEELYSYEVPASEIASKGRKTMRSFIELLSWVGTIFGSLIVIYNLFLRVQVKTHRAYLNNGPLPYYFIKIINLSPIREVEVTHVWFQNFGSPSNEVHILNPQNPLPRRLKPQEIWETWIAVNEIPNMGEQVYDMFIIELSNGRRYKSKKNKKVPTRGQLPVHNDLSGLTPPTSGADY